MERNAIKSITIVLVLLLVYAIPAGAVTVSITDASDDYGTTVDIPIDVSGTSNIGATDISLTYDPDVISPTGVVANGTLISATDLIANYTGTSGIVNVSVASLSGIPDTGSIAIVQFSVVGSSGATSPLTLSTVDAYDLDRPITVGGNVTGYEELTVTSTSGTFTATGVGGDWRDEWTGLDSEDGSAVTTAELQDGVYHWLNDVPVRAHAMTTADLQEIVALWLS